MKFLHPKSSPFSIKRAITNATFGIPKEGVLAGINLVRTVSQTKFQSNLTLLLCCFLPRCVENIASVGKAGGGRFYVERVQAMASLCQQIQSDLVEAQQLLDEGPEVRTSIQVSSECPDRESHVSRKNGEHPEI